MGRLHTEKTRRPDPVGDTGVTLTELVVSMLIAGILLSTAAIYLSGYFPKHRLNNEAQKLRNFLVLAQQKAREREETYCLTIKLTSPVTFYVYRDGNDDRVCPDGTASDTLFSSLELDPDLSIPTCSMAFYWNTQAQRDRYRIFFLSDGHMPLIDMSVAAKTEIAQSAMLPDRYPDYEIILSSNKLGLGQKSREVELLTSVGRVDLVPRGSLGYRYRIASATFTPLPIVSRQPDMNAVPTPRFCEE